MPNLNFAAFSPRPLALTIHDLPSNAIQSSSPGAPRLAPLIGARALAKRADVVLAVSTHQARLGRTLQALAGKDSRHPSRVSERYRSPIAPERLAETRRRLDLPERFILHVGTFEPRKNHLALLDAFA